MSLRKSQFAALSAAMALLFVGCAVPESRVAVRTDTTPSVAFEPGVKQIDLARGLWGTQSITPPIGLVTVREGNLIGRTIDADGVPYLTVEYLLVDPNTGDARYAVSTSNEFGDYLLVPLSALRITPWAVSLDATPRTLRTMPKFSAGDLEHRYPRTALAVPIAAPPPIAAVSVLPPAAVTAAPPPHPEALQLTRRGSVVGYPVFDSYGQPIGTVDAVAAVAITGEVHYVIVAGPSFGVGNYIVVPATSARLAGERVMLVGGLANWTQAPRYRSEQVPQVFGALGTAD
jgi:hypothetical protein